MIFNERGQERSTGRRVVEARKRRRVQPTLLALEGRQLLSTYTVNSTGDTGSGSGLFGDLRYCITQVNSAGGDQTIVFDQTMFQTPQTITLSGTQLDLSDSTGTETITGPTAGVTIDANKASRVFEVDEDVTASISGLTITDGTTSGNGGGLYNDGGNVTLTGCTVSGNAATTPGSSRGGGLYSVNGTITLSGCTVTNNTSACDWRWVERSRRERPR